MSLDVSLIYDDPEKGTVYDANITHNLGKMAHAVGLYEAVWRPEEHQLTHAAQLVPILERGIAELALWPRKYTAFDSPNGWGKYRDFLPWLQAYLEACREHPTARIYADR